MHRLSERRGGQSVDKPTLFGSPRGELADARYERLTERWKMFIITPFFAIFACFCNLSGICECIRKCHLPCKGRQIHFVDSLKIPSPNREGIFRLWGSGGSLPTLPTKSKADSVEDSPYKGDFRGALDDYRLPFVIIKNTNMVVPHRAR